ncbi:MAG: hypothetical protein IKE58_00065 [Blautia sp.]|nr:hypothetical protein [Blautia sp.]
MSGSVLYRTVGDILIIVVLYSLISGTIKTVKSAREELKGQSEEKAEP